MPEHFRSFEEVVKYAPNQAYIGNILPDEMNSIPKPWYKNPMENAKAEGKLGEIVGQEEFLLNIKRRVLEIDFRIQRFTVQRGNQLPMLQLEQDFGHGGNTGGRLQVADVRLG